VDRLGTKNGRTCVPFGKNRRSLKGKGRGKGISKPTQTDTFGVITDLTLEQVGKRGGETAREKPNDPLVGTSRQERLGNFPKIGYQPRVHTSKKKITYHRRFQEKC